MSHAKHPPPPPFRDFRAKKNHTRNFNHYVVIQSQNVVLHLGPSLSPNISDYFNRIRVKFTHAHTKCHILILIHPSGKNEVIGERKREQPVYGVLALTNI